MLGSGMLDLAVVIPLYNEIDCLTTLAARIRELRTRLDAASISHEILIVDDGSTDGSSGELDRIFGGGSAIRVLHQERNGGIGSAVRAGLSGADARWIATVDADTNYDLREIPVLLEEARRRNVDLVTASPWHPDGSRRDFPLHRYIFSIGVAWLYALVLAPRGRTIYTFTAGFRVYRGNRIHEILPTANDFVSTAELFINAILSGWSWHEIPWKVANRESGVSKLKTLKTIRGHLLHMVRILMRRASRPS